MPNIHLNAVADTYVNAKRPDENFGGNDALAALSPPSSETAHSYILFDLSSIPKYSRIDYALLVFKKRGGGYGDVTVECRKVTSGWDEYGTTWNNRPSLSEVYASKVSPDPFSEETFEFRVEAIVQEWVNNLSLNFGFGLTAVNGNRIVAARNASYPPDLYIEYTPNATPNAPGLHTPVHGSVTNNRNPVFNWTFSDPDSGDYQTAWQIQISAGDGGAFTNIVMDSGKNTTATNQWTFYNFGDNQYYYRIRTWDRYDAVSPWSWVPQFGIENQPPSCTGGTPSPRYLKVDLGGTFRVEVTGVSDNWSGVQKVQFATWTEANGQDDIRWYDGVNAGNGTWYFDVPIANHGNAEGKYNCHVYAWDNAGNSANIRVIDTYVDRMPPTVASVQGYSYSNQTSGTRRVWIYGVNDTVSGMNNIDVWYQKPDQQWIQYGNTIASGSDYYADIPVTLQGEYTVRFYPYDRAGNAKTGGYETKFFVDSQRANDPNVSVTYGETAANFTWLLFSDPTPSSGYARTLFYLGEWTGTAWVGGAPNLFNGTEVTTDINVIEKSVSKLKPGVRYRYTVTHYDKAGNESAYTYREFVTKRKIGVMRYKAGLAELSLTIYDPESGVLGSKALRIATPAGIGCFELVATDATMTNFRIQTTKGILTIN